MISYRFVPVTCLHQLYGGALPHFWKSRSEMDRSFTLSTEILYLYLMAAMDFLTCNGGSGLDLVNGSVKSYPLLQYCQENELSNL